MALCQVPSDTVSAMSSVIVQHQLIFHFSLCWAVHLLHQSVLTQTGIHSPYCVDRNKVFTGMPHDAAQVEREHGMLLPKSFFDNLVRN